MRKHHPRNTSPDASVGPAQRGFVHSECLRSRCREPAKGPSSYGTPIFAGKFDPKQLAADWLAFSGYDSVLMTESDWSNVPAGARNAIVSWMNLGGHLVIYSSDNPQPNGIAVLGLPRDSGFGRSRSSHRVPQTLKPRPEHWNSYSTTIPLGATPIPSEATTTALGRCKRTSAARTFITASSSPCSSLFGILVGPINLFVLAKSGQRHRLFITTPLISLGASLILIALIIFQDGFGGSGMRRVLMEVRPDAGQNAAFLHQEQISRTGILTHSRFTVDPACLFLPGAHRQEPLGPLHGQLQHPRHLQSPTRRRQNGGIRRLVAKPLRTWPCPDRRRLHPRPHRAHRRSRLLRLHLRFPHRNALFSRCSKQWHRAESITTGKPFTPTPCDAWPNPLSPTKPTLSPPATAK